MTIQQLDNLVCTHPRIDLTGYKIDSGQVWFSLPIPFSECEVPDGTVTCVCSALWRGYLATFRLNTDGTFELILLEQPYFEPPFRQEISLVYDGNFKISFQKYFGWDSPSKTIPFENGVIVEDESRWIVYEPKPEFRPKTIAEFRNALISDTNMSGKACSICNDLNIRTVGELYERRSEFEAHPDSDNTQRRFMIDVLVRIPKD